MYDNRIFIVVEFMDLYRFVGTVTLPMFVRGAAVKRHIKS